MFWALASVLLQNAYTIGMTISPSSESCKSVGCTIDDIRWTKIELLSCKLRKKVSIQSSCHRNSAFHLCYAISNAVHFRRNIFSHFAVFECSSFCQPNNVLLTHLSGSQSCINTDGTAGIGPTDSTKLWKSACYDAYSYNFDDATSTFVCPTGTDYEVAFCP